jgi:hypothetical protein
MYVLYIEKMRNTYIIFDAKPEWKRLLGRLRSKWEDNIKMGLRELGCSSIILCMRECEKMAC